MKLDFGCGPNHRVGYDGVDINPDCGAKYIADCRQLPLPFEDDSVDAISSSHFLEHLSTKEVVPLMKEFARILKPNGTLEAVTPDLEAACRLFIETPEPERWTWPVHVIYGSQENPWQFHRTGYTVERMMALATLAGLQPLQVMQAWDGSAAVVHLTARKPPASTDPTAPPRSGSEDVPKPKTLEIPTY